MGDKIDIATLLSAASTFAELRAGLMDVLRDNLTVEDGYRIEGCEACAEALIFFFAERLHPTQPPSPDLQGRE